MASCRFSHQMVVLYEVSFGENTKNIEVVRYEDEEREHRWFGVNDPFWNEVLRYVKELFDIDANAFRGRSSSKQGARTLPDDEEEILVEDFDMEDEGEETNDAIMENDDNDNQDAHRSPPRAEGVAPPGEWDKDTELEVE
ncbi:hypothetical protein CJ030_MR3G027883 [Morella rubra]|uniref:Uncharacterized protein n=1 Tax=Morella rubra TaxID=262757 RepID=A0A6A1W687_9ROSI|nr:hypothetical protein CJ030_MR3G027883 [Morella rubra]